jgi:hypothetical protein
VTDAVLHEWCNVTEKDTLLNGLYLGSLKTYEGNISLKAAKGVKHIFHMYTHIFCTLLRCVTKDELEHCCVICFWKVSDYVTDMVKMFEVQLICTKVKLINMITVIVAEYVLVPYAF